MSAICGNTELRIVCRYSESSTNAGCPRVVQIMLLMPCQNLSSPLYEYLARRLTFSYSCNDLTLLSPANTDERTVFRRAGLLARAPNIHMVEMKGIEPFSTTLSQSKSQIAIYLHDHNTFNLSKQISIKRRILSKL